MVGVNQVIMLSLNIVIIASMIGAGGLGFDVLGALRRLDIGAGLEAGFAIVALAIVLDRLSQAVAIKLQIQTHRRASATARSLRRHPYLVAALALVVVTGILGLVAAGRPDLSRGWRLSTGDFWANIIALDQRQLLRPARGVQELPAAQPADPGQALPRRPALARRRRHRSRSPGWRLGGWRLALLAGCLGFLIAATGQWEKAMITVYLCGISVLIAALIGIPIGILAAEKRRLWPAVQAVDRHAADAALLRLPHAGRDAVPVGDFTAMIAVVAYAVAPAIRYTALRPAQVDPSLVEAGRAAGRTPWQLLTKIKLKLALPEIMLGLNQTIMLALSMLVITALVGTRDLGQEVYIALAKADTGRGIVAGLAVAFIAIIADRLIAARRDSRAEDEARPRR